MKHFIISTLFTLLLPLAACTEKEITGGETPTVPQTGFRLSARLGQGAATRAVGDAFAAQSDEKRIDRLAFFVHTDEDGFQVYPPAPDDGTTTLADDPNHVHLTETPPADSRQYTAEVILTAGGGYMADIVAVANLPEDYDYSQIITWQGLQDSVLVWATEMPSCTPGTGIDDPARRAFVMYSYIRHELTKEENNAFTLAMERLAARIDITNEAYVTGMTPADPKGGFLLSSVRLLHARPASYITPQMDYTSPDVATVSNWEVTDIPYGKAATADPSANPTGEPDKVETADAETDSTLQYLWRSLYTYENSDTEHAPTALEIKGAFRGMEVTRRIDFIDKDKQPVPIVRNHRYLVRILPAPGLTDITFDIKVSEWDAVDTVNVKPDQTEVPVISNMESNLTEYINSEGQKTYDLYYTQDGEMTFDATCSFAPGIRVKYYNDKTGTWTTDDNWITISKTAEEVIPVTRSANTYKCSYKVTFPKFDTGLSRQAMLLVHNGGSEVECDTIRIRHTVTYPGTDFKPEAVATRDDGSDIIVAPVNVGATKVVDKLIYIDSRSTEDELQEFFECVGYYFQWGRKSGQKNRVMKSESVKGPISIAEESNKEYQDKLIRNEEKKELGSWSSDSDPTLWNDGSDTNPVKGRNDPCPSGWRVITKQELYKIKDKIVVDSKKYIATIKDSDIKIPAVGALIALDSDLSSFVYIGSLCWHSSLSESEELAATLLTIDKESTTYGKVPAIPVRCIQE